jgi:hypothetical protein
MLDNDTNPPQDTTDGFSQQMQQDFAALQINLPDHQAGAAGGLTKTSMSSYTVILRQN